MSDQNLAGANLTNKQPKVVCIKCLSSQNTSETVRCPARTLHVQGPLILGNYKQQALIYHCLCKF